MAVSAAMAGRGVATERQSLSFIIAASSTGTLIEWYDFYLYGVLAGSFGNHFFPGDMKQGFLYSLGIFWTGFVVRPFGAVIFGHLGDLIGRKFTFMLTLALMGLATFLVGCLPTYATIGWTAPVLLVAGEDDVVVPPRAVRAGSTVLSAADTSLMTAPGGHLGVLCGRASRDRLWPALCAFLDRHDPPEEIEPDRRTSRRPSRAVRRPLPAAHPAPAAGSSEDPVDEPPHGPPGEPDDGPAASAAPSVPGRPAGRRSRPAPKPATRTRGREG